MNSAFKSSSPSTLQESWMRNLSSCEAFSPAWWVFPSLCDPWETSAVPSYAGSHSPCRATSDKECPLKHVFERTQGPKPKVYFPANSVSKQQIKPGNTYLHSNFCMRVYVPLNLPLSLSLALSLPLFISLVLFYPDCCRCAFILPPLWFVNLFLYNCERAPGGKLEPEIRCSAGGCWKM